LSDRSATNRPGAGPSFAGFGKSLTWPKKPLMRPVVTQPSLFLSANRPSSAASAINKNSCRKKIIGRQAIQLKTIETQPAGHCTQVAIQMCQRFPVPFY